MQEIKKEVAQSNRTALILFVIFAVIGIAVLFSLGKPGADEREQTRKEIEKVEELVRKFSQTEKPMQFFKSDKEFQDYVSQGLAFRGGMGGNVMTTSFVGDDTGAPAPAKIGSSAERFSGTNV